jgi:hypothetical protein
MGTDRWSLESWLQFRGSVSPEVNLPHLIIVIYRMEMMCILHLMQ